MSTAPIGLMNNLTYFDDGGFSSNKKIKHHHPHTSIFCDTKKRKSRFKVGGNLYFIEDDEIQTTHVLSTNFLNDLKLWQIETERGFFLDRKIDEKSGQVGVYPYINKYNALKHLRRRILRKLDKIESEIGHLIDW